MISEHDNFVDKHRTRRVNRPEYIDRRLPISYVDYDTAAFTKLYNEGSLFLYHAFFEGRLLNGDKARWERLKSRFIVLDDFKDSIDEYLEVLAYIDEYPDYEYSSVPYLSNIFKCLKNIGIFRLASEQYYNFEKISALELGCGLNISVARTLILANAVFERSSPVSPQLMDEFRSSASEWKRRLHNQIERLMHDI